MNPKVDAYLDRAERWQVEMKALRKILHECDLGEELKWGKPCYTARGSNIAIMQPFKAHLALMFFKGVLLDDREDVLRSQGKNSQSARRMEFTSIDQVTQARSTVKAYIRNAIAVEEAGLEVPARQMSDYEFPDELLTRFKEDKAYKKAFESLTPGRQRSYLLHFSGAKQAKTREDRIERCLPKILQGKGYNER